MVYRVDKKGKPKNIGEKNKLLYRALVSIQLIIWGGMPVLVENLYTSDQLLSKKGDHPSTLWYSALFL
jgi:hypothetical protein